MKRIILLIITSVFCLMAHAEWIEAAETDDYLVYINSEINKDDFGNYMAWFKYVPQTSSLTRIRKGYYREFKKKGYLKLTHFMNLYKYSLRDNKSMLITTTYYASGKPIETVNYDYVSEWQYPVPESLSEAMMEAVKLLVIMQESD